jgi:hypothetical protein
VASVVKGRILGFLIRSVTCRDRYRVHSWGRVCRFREAFAARFWFLVSGSFRLQGSLGFRRYKSVASGRLSEIGFVGRVQRVLYRQRR